MAGIGFVLERLMKRDDLIGVSKGIGYAAVISSGPWLLTVLSLGMVSVGSGFGAGVLEGDIFRSIVIYNFSGSLVLSGPIAMITTRFLADRIYTAEVEPVPATLLCGLGCVGVLSIFAGIVFYFLIAELPLMTATLAVANFISVSFLWYVMVFLTALKDYLAISRAFVLGLIVSTIASIALAQVAATDGMLAGYTLGLTIIVFIVIAKILAEYPYRFADPLAARPYFLRYWELALGGAVFSAAIWIDKWIMWFAPASKTVGGALTTYTAYDGAMFLAYLTVIPALSLFLVSAETSFFRVYQKFYRAISRHATYTEIKERRQDIATTLTTASRNLLVLQGAVSVLAIVLAPRIIALTGSSYEQIGIFRLGVLGAFFHAVVLFQSTLLAYFDLRRINLILQIVFLLLNGTLTFICLQLGPNYYGFGYFAAGVLSSILGYLALLYAVTNLPYLTFVRR